MTMRKDYSSIFDRIFNQILKRKNNSMIPKNRRSEYTIKDNIIFEFPAIYIYIYNLKIKHYTLMENIPGLRLQQ